MLWIGFAGYRFSYVLWQHIDSFHLRFHSVSVSAGSCLYRCIATRLFHDALQLHLNSTSTTRSSCAQTAVPRAIETPFWCVDYASINPLTADEELEVGISIFFPWPSWNQCSPGQTWPVSHSRPVPPWKLQAEAAPVPEYSPALETSCLPSRQKRKLMIYYWRRNRRKWKWE